MGRSPWVALEATTDRRQRARELIKAHRRAMGGAEEDASVREVIRNSWNRSQAAGVDPAVRSAPVRFSDEESQYRLERGPLALAPPVLRRLREDVQAEDEQIALLCDPDGTILWMEGDPNVLDRAKEIRLSVGAVWSEEAVGTNAMGTALAVDHPVQIFSAEHFAEPVHEWTCAAAPLHDPDTGECIGVIDLSGGLSTAHPHSLALVASAARTIESLVREERRQREERIRARIGPEAYLLASPSVKPAGVTHVEALGRDRIQLVRGRQSQTLTPRHSEIVLSLLLRPDGLTAGELTLAVWGEHAKPTTARAELFRLRGVLGDVLETRPYRLRGRFRGDFDEVRALTGQNRLSDALERYPGLLLPDSEVPLIEEARNMLDEDLRSALMTRGDPVLLERWLSHPAGEDDSVACRELLSLLPEGDSRRAQALAHMRKITAAGKR